MVNPKDVSYYLGKISTDINFCLKNLEGCSYEEFVRNELLSCAICFKLVQISENSKNLKSLITQDDDSIPWHKMTGLRNRIVHDYGGVDLVVVYDTVTTSLPVMETFLEKIKNLF